MRLFTIFNLVAFEQSIVVAALRVYAVSGREWRLALFTLALALVPVATNLVVPVLHLVYDILNRISSLAVPRLPHYVYR